MSKCPYCGKEYSDEVTKCPIDRSHLGAKAPTPRSHSNAKGNMRTRFRRTLTCARWGALLFGGMTLLAILLAKLADSMLLFVVIAFPYICFLGILAQGLENFPLIGLVIIGNTVLGAILFGVGGLIYQFLKWDHERREAE
jgi:hypothetical protein